MVNERKRNIVTKLCECFLKYNQVVIVSLDNVSTNQIHAARKILNVGTYKGEMIIGKNVRIITNFWVLRGYIAVILTDLTNPYDDFYLYA